MRSFLIYILLLPICLVFVISCSEERYIKYNERTESKDGMDLKRKMNLISAHETERKLYRLSEDLIIYSDDGLELGRISKGVIVRKASIFDLESGDVGNNELYSIMINKSDNVNLEVIGQISEADEFGVYETTAQK